MIFNITDMIETFILSPVLYGRTSQLRMSTNVNVTRLYC